MCSLWPGSKKLIIVLLFCFIFFVWCLVVERYGMLSSTLTVDLVLGMAAGFPSLYCWFNVGSVGLYDSRGTQGNVAVDSGEGRGGGGG